MPSSRGGVIEPLPLISVFGKKMQPPGAPYQEGTVDFRWEREWRFPYARGVLKFTSTDIFVGLCQHEEITEFESAYRPIKFIDPRRNMKWYDSKLIQSRQRLNLKESVV